MNFEDGTRRWYTHYAPMETTIPDKMIQETMTYDTIRYDRRSISLSLFSIFYGVEGKHTHHPNAKKIEIVFTK